MSKIVVKKQEYANNGTHADEIEAVVKENILTNTLSTSTDNAPTVGLLKSEVDSLINAKSRNRFTGDIDSTTIPVGIYSLGASDSYTHASITNFVPSWCLFIQTDVFNTQIILHGDYVYVRKRTGDPLEWNSWNIYMPDKMKLKTFSVDSTTAYDGIYCGEKALTSTDIENARVVLPQYARKSGYPYPCVCAYEGGAVRVQSPVSLTGITVGLLLIK